MSNNANNKKSNKKVATPFFSVLIPNLGFNPYFKDCINSIVNQKDLDVNYEVIICDQSNKSIYDKILVFLNTLHFKVDLFHTEIKSLLNARHELANKSKGSYLVFIDSDDFIEDTYLKNIYDSIKKSNFPDILFQNIKLTDEHGNVLKKQLKVPSKCSNNIKNYFYYSNYFNSIVRKIFKRNLYDGDKKHLHITNGEDWIFSLPLVQKAETLFFNQKLNQYHYRQINSSMTHTVSYENVISAIYFKDNLISPCKDRFQKKLLLKQKIFDFYQYFIMLIKNKRLNKDAFIFECKRFRKNLSDKEVNIFWFNISKQTLIYYLIEFKCYRLIYFIFSSFVS